MNQILKSSNQLQETIDSSGFSDLKTYLESIQGSPIKKWDNTKSYPKDELAIYNDLFYQSIVVNSTLGTFIISEWKLIGGNSSIVSNIDDINKSATTTYSSNKMDSTYVKQEVGKSLVDNTKVTKLDNISDNANKVETSTINGKIKIDGVEKTVFTQTQADWNETDNTKDGFINNKPTIVKINDSSTTSTTDTYSIDKIKVLIDSGTSFEVVSILPSSGIKSNKIYILNSDFSLNYYDSSSWHLLGGSNQISIGTTAPSDITKLFLDITDKTKPILKWYDSTTTSWINISESIQIQSDWNQTDNTKSDYIKNKPNVNNATSINSHNVDNSTYSANRVLVADNSGNYIHANVNVAGIVATNGTILQPSGSPVTIASGEEKTFGYPSCYADKMLINIQEQIAGSSITDNHLDFSDSSKYSLQNNTLITCLNNKAMLKSTSYTSIVPIMTSNSQAGFIVSASSEYGVENTKAYNAFDNTTINGWVAVSGTKTGWLKIQLPSAMIVTKYSMVERTGDSVLRMAKAWTFEGSNDNTNWIILDTQTNQTSWNNGTKIEYNINNLTSYLYYRINVTANNGDTSILSVGDLQLFKSNYTLTPTYLKTTGASNLSLTTIDTINSLNMPVTLPSVNTTCKILTSFDNGTNWLYKDGTGWHKYTGNLIINWTSSNSNVDLQVYFTNLSMITLKSDLSSLSISPVSLDFMWQLNTTDLTITPTVSPVTLTYTTLPHLEASTFGRYDDAYATFGVKIIRDPNDNTKTNQMAVKNLSNKSRIANPNVIVTTS